jgi:NADP-reducing hydrogenase subunit HndC
LWGYPSVLNNVETYANVPGIILNGGSWLARYGTEKSKGTKVFALAGTIKNSGLVEVPVGTPLGELIFDVGGGIPNARDFKAAQIGGPSGGCIPAQYLDTPVEYDTLGALGSIMGSGGMIVMDERDCMVNVAKYFLDFTMEESCGKCTPCREGTLRLMEMLESITKGVGTLEDIDQLMEMSQTIKDGSLCGLGQTAPNPVLTTIKYFRDEYEAHITQKKCPAKVCKDLITFRVDEEKCNGCGRCRLVCPVEAVEGAKKELHKILQEKCIKCGTCFDRCKFDAIIVE